MNECDHTVGMDSLWSHMISASELAERGANALDLQEPFKFCPDCGAQLVPDPQDVAPAQRSAALSCEIRLTHPCG
jgi:NADH pyrophosphatase NudC (nudix superfamily)